MRRRHLIKTAGVVTAAGIAGCIHDDNGEEPNGDENGNGDNDEENGGENGEENGGADDVGRTDTGEETRFDWTFEITRLEAGNDIDDIDVEFEQDENRVVVEGTTYGSNLCKTAELESAGIITDSGEDDVQTLAVSVATRDVEGAGDVCAEAIREIDYVATFEFEDEDDYPNRVNVSHDGRSVGGAAWDAATDADVDD